MVLGFFASLLLIGTPVVFRYVGTGGVAAYWIGGACCYVIREPLIAAFNRVDLRYVWALGAGTLALLAAAVFALYPLANSGALGGGSDSDDALNIAVRALLRHEDPYALKTYLGAPVTYLPGAFLLATPFVLAGSAAYQNIFWFVVFFAAVYHYLGDVRRTVVLLWIMLGSLQIWQSLVTGGEVLASGLYVPLAILFMMRALLNPDLARVRWWASVLLGVALCSRANYLLLVPILCSAVIQTAGWRRGARLGMLTAGTMAALILPMALSSPRLFWISSVKEQNSSAIGLTSVLPHADVILPALSACVALALACRRMKTESSVLASCAVAQAYPVLMLIVIHLAMSRGGHRGIIWAVGYACYGLHFIFLWALASHRRLLMGRPAAAAMSAVP